MTARAAAVLLAAPATAVLVWLTVSASPLGADAAVAASCSSDGVSLAYDVRYDPAMRTHVTTAVLVSSISPACAGQRLELTVAPSDDRAAPATAAAQVTGTSVEVPLPHPVPVSSPVTVSVLVTG